MESSISSGLKTTFLVHSLVAAVLGVLYLAVPAWFGDTVGWPAAQPFDHQVIGTVFLAFAAGSALASREKYWERVKVLVQLHLVWTVLASLLILGAFDRLECAEADGFDFVHLLVEATKQAFGVRDAHITDPAYMDKDPATFLQDSVVGSLVVVAPRKE